MARPAARHLLIVLSMLWPLLSAAAVHGAAIPSQQEAEGRRGAFPEVVFGIKGGGCLAQHAGTDERDSEYGVSSRLRAGFGAGAFLCAPVTSRLALQQEAAYVQKGSRQEITVDILEIPTVLDVTYEMDYVELPVLMRFTWIRSPGFSLYSLSGTALSLKVRDRYVLSGEIDDGTQVVPLRADADMSEVDMFDFSFVYGLGVEFPLGKRRILVEHRFVMGWNTLSMPTYAYIPFGDERLLIENEPVPLKNQAHLLQIGVAF